MTSREELLSRFTIADYVIFVAMLAVSAAIGVYYACTGGKQKTTQEFFMGGRSMGVFPVAMSILASFMSAIPMLGIPAETYLTGTQFWMVVVAYVLMFPTVAYVYMPVFYNLNLSSVYEYLGMRFSRGVRSTCSTIFTIQMVMYMAIVMYAPSLALSQVTGLKVWFCVLSIGIVCTFYTTIYIRYTYNDSEVIRSLLRRIVSLKRHRINSIRLAGKGGGMKAVVLTDLFQVFVIFGAMMVIVIKSVHDLGGIETVWNIGLEGNRIEFFNFDFDPTVRHTVWSLTIGGFFTWLSIYGVSQPMVQRYLTISNVKGAKTAIWLNLPGLSTIVTVTTLAGLLVYAKYNDCDPIKTKQVGAPDQLLPLFVMDTLGMLPCLPGIFVAGIFSGAISTVSSGVNSLAAVTLEDIVKTYIKPDISEDTATKLAKILALSYGVASIALVAVVEQLGAILQLSLSVFGVIGGPILGVFSLGIFFPWANAKGAAAGLGSGIVIVLWIALGAFFNKTPVPFAPFSVEGCPELFYNATGSVWNTTVVANSTTAPLLDKSDVFVLYRLSYMWYSAIGFLIVIIIGLIISFLTGSNKNSEVKKELISPITHRIMAFMEKVEHNKTVISLEIRPGGNKRTSSYNPGEDSSYNPGEDSGYNPGEDSGYNPGEEKPKSREGVVNNAYLRSSRDNVNVAQVENGRNIPVAVEVRRT